MAKNAPRNHPWLRAAFLPDGGGRYEQTVLHNDATARRLSARPRSTADVFVSIPPFQRVISAPTEPELLLEPPVRDGAGGLTSTCDIRRREWLDARTAAVVDWWHRWSGVESQDLVAGKTGTCELGARLTSGFNRSALPPAHHRHLGWARGQPTAPPRANKRVPAAAAWGAGNGAVIAKDLPVRQFPPSLAPGSFKAKTKPAAEEPSRPTSQAGPRPPAQRWESQVGRARSSFERPVASRRGTNFRAPTSGSREPPIPTQSRPAPSGGAQTGLATEPPASAARSCNPANLLLPGRRPGSQSPRPASPAQHHRKQHHRRC